MSRLYYDPPKPDPNDPLLPKTVAGKRKKEAYNYLEKVSRLIPAEVLAAYLTFFGLAELIKHPNSQVIWHWIIWGACLVATPFYLLRTADKGKPKIVHLFVSSLAFCAWSYAINGKILQDTLSPGTYDQAIASLCVGLFSLLIGTIPLKF